MERAVTRGGGDRRVERYQTGDQIRRVPTVTNGDR
jgi:hypothetical protein